MGLAIADNSRSFGCGRCDVRARVYTPTEKPPRIQINRTPLSSAAAARELLFWSLTTRPQGCPSRQRVQVITLSESMIWPATRGTIHPSVDVGGARPLRCYSASMDLRPTLRRSISCPWFLPAGRARGITEHVPGSKSCTVAAAVAPAKLPAPHGPRLLRVVNYVRDSIRAVYHRAAYTATFRRGRLNGWMNNANHSWDYTAPATAPTAPSAPAASTVGAHPAAPVILILRWLTAHQPRQRRFL